MTFSKETSVLFNRVEQLLDKVEDLLPPGDAKIDWSAIAFRWRRRNARGFLQAIPRPHQIRLSDLHQIERQRQEVERNTRQFVQGLPANNVLLSGSRGTGKSTLVKALLNEFHEQGLRLIEVDKAELIDLPDIIDCLYGRRERFIIFSDDLSFEGDDPSYKALKAVLDGSISAPPDNVLLYATSNRRHLMPEYMSDNLSALHQDGEIHHSEAVEEKVSLSERFGLWLSFYPFNQDAYLDIVNHWLIEFGLSEGVADENARAAALRWALGRGSRSGRSGFQFAKDWAGRAGLETGGCEGNNAK